MFDGESGDLAVGDGRTEGGWAGSKQVGLLEVGQEQM